MKILIYTHEYPPFLGGLATTSYKLNRGLSSKYDLQTFVLAPSYGNTDKDIDKELGGNIKRIPLLRKRITIFIPFLYYLTATIYFFITLRKIKPDVVLFITEEAEASGGFISYFCKFESIPRVAGSGITTCFVGKRPFKKLLSIPLSRLYRKSKNIIAVSNYSRKLLEQIGVGRNKVVVIKNGISNKFISNSPDHIKIEKLKEIYSLKPGEKVLMTIARILPRKGQDNVIRALQTIEKRLGDFKYLIVGTGSYEAEFKELARSLGLGNRVVFTGGVSHEEIIHYLDLCDVFVHANRLWNNKVEGLPNAVLEASARAKPVIVGNDSGSVESVIDGSTGYLVDSENIENIAGVILKLFNNAELREEMGRNGKKMIAERFTEDVMIENYYKLFKSYKEQVKHRADP